MLEATDGSRIAGYVALHAMHTGCKECGRPGVQCPIGHAQLICRDLVVLTVSTGRGPLTAESLQKALEQALLEGCGREVLDHTEQSQLTQSFNKVLSLGKTRAGFDDRVRSTKMYGPLTDEEVDQVYMVYNACSRLS